jgi:TolB-like protein/DNA-binding winged helix-turn-helix (wHTH) protein/Tfp pilus assembly protein PilF
MNFFLTGRTFNVCNHLQSRFCGFQVRLGRLAMSVLLRENHDPFPWCSALLLMRDRIYRFGEFELNVAEGELRTRSSVVRLQQKPLLLLISLLESPQRVVSRDQLRQTLWGSATFVDHEQGINVAIKKVRDALGDSVENPRLVETLAKKGYRFLLPVEVVGGETAQGTHSGTQNGLAAADANSRDKREPYSRWSWIWAGVAAGVLATVGIWLFRVEAKSHNATKMSSLAVLPLRDLSPDPGQEYLADGITEELITSLAQALPLRVISRTSVMRYKQTSEPITQIARELGVDAIVEGAVVRGQNRVKVTVQLIDATKDRHLWAQSYDRNLGDFLGMEAELSHEIARQVGNNLSLRPQISVNSRAVSPEVYELYLRGRFFWNKRTDQGMKKAAEYFQQAIDQDPNYAQAYVGLADCYLFGEPPTLPPESLAVKTKEMAKRALELDESLGEAHATLGLISQNFDRDWGGAESEYRRAIELNPNYATAHQWYGEHLALRGRFDEGLEEMKIARDLDPLSLVIIKDMGEVYYAARKYDEAIGFFRKALDMDSHFILARRFLAMAYLQKREFSSAIAELEAVTQEEENSDTMAELAYAYALSGRREEAEKVLHDFKGISERRSSQAFDYALIYTGLGNKDKAFEWLEKAYREHAGLLVGLGVDPRWDSLRADHRFGDLMGRMQ